MKHCFLLVFLLLSIPNGILHGQEYSNCQGISFDSVRVNFVSLNENILDVSLVSNKHTLSLFGTGAPPRFENVLIYQTHAYDTIDYLFSRIKIILENPPITDTSVIINDCCHGMDISVFDELGKTCERTYTHYPTAYFPFAYAELYSLIRQWIVKYWRRE